MAPELKRAAFLTMVGPLSIVFAAVIVWYASPATLSLTRTGPDTVSVSIASKLFGQRTTTTTRYDGVRSVDILRGQGPRRDIHDDRLVFHTATDTIDRTRAQQLFRADFLEINRFLTDSDSQTLSISSIARWQELSRFVFAHVAAAFLLLLGVGLISLAVNEARHRNRDVLIRGVDY